MPDETITGILGGVLILLLNEYRRYRIRRRKKTSVHPPPPTATECKQCFFFQAFKKEWKKKNGNKNMRDSQIMSLFMGENTDEID